METGDLPPPKPLPGEKSPERQRLGALDDRRRNVRVTPAARAYTSFVHKLRWVLPGLAALILGVLLVWPKVQVEISERRFAPSQLDKAALEQAATENRLINANFSSVDSSGRPFTLTSSEALQENGNPDTILLQNPKGSLKIDDNVTMTAEAKNGIYAQKNQHLTLNDDVVLTRSDGTRMNTQTLFINLMTNDSSTEAPVTIDGPQGHLTAQGMTMEKAGALTVFKGPARLTLNPKTKPGAL